MQEIHDADLLAAVRTVLGVQCTESREQVEARDLAVHHVQATLALHNLRHGMQPTQVSGAVQQLLVAWREGFGQQAKPQPPQTCNRQKMYNALLWRNSTPERQSKKALRSSATAASQCQCMIRG